MAHAADTITSVRNRRIVAAASLAQRAGRRATGQYLVEGPRAVADAMAAGHVRTVFVVEDRAERYADAAAEVVVVADHVLARLADSRSPQGVVALARQVVAPLDAVTGQGTLLVLHEPADPGNLGTIIRTADAAGVAAVVITGQAVDPWNPKAVRASTGSVCHVPLVTDTPWSSVLAACRAADQWIVAMDARAGTDVDVLERKGPPVAIVMGNEAHGLPPGILEAADVCVAVPTYGRAESLNLAAAAAVTLYAAARGRRPARRHDGEAMTDRAR